VDLVNNIKSAYALMKELSVMGVETCLDHFSQNEASYKVLKYLKNPYVKLSEKVLDAEVGTIDPMLQRINEFRAKIIVPKVPDQRTIKRAWLATADFVPKEAL
jgi:EAL domain-containing protein (putative c-di-GMP-specific phosphodiesterase class I)